MDQPDHPQLTKADTLRQNGEYDEAIALYEQILSDAPDNAPARHGLGLSVCFIGEFERSIEELEKLRESAPDYLKGRVDLFKTYLMLGMNDEAKEEARAILAVDPGNEEIQKHIVYFPDF